MPLDDTEPGRALSRWSRGRARDSAVSVRIEVPFHDVDSLGIVWHGHYFKYLECARTALMREHGLDARDLRELGFGMVMIDCRCRHVAPLRYADVAVVSAWLCDVEHRIRIGYEIEREDGTRVARAETALATVTLAGELRLNTPEAILRRLRSRPAARAEAGAGARP